MKFIFKHMLFHTNWSSRREAVVASCVSVASSNGFTLLLQEDVFTTTDAGLNYTCTDVRKGTKKSCPNFGTGRDTSILIFSRGKPVHISHCPFTHEVLTWSHDGHESSLDPGPGFPNWGSAGAADRRCMNWANDDVTILHDDVTCASHLYARRHRHARCMKRANDDVTIHMMMWHARRISTHEDIDAWVVLSIVP